MNNFYNLSLLAFGASFIAYGYFILKMMYRLPLKSWFPFGIWKFSTLRNILGEHYESTMRPVFYTAASTFAIGALVALLSMTNDL